MTFQVHHVGVAAQAPTAAQGPTGGHAVTAVTRYLMRAAAWRHMPRRAVASVATRLRDRMDARTLAEHTPTFDDNSAWCTHHWGGLEEWPCQDYTAARAAQGRRRPS